MAWIELRDTIANNKKTMRLKRILKCGTAEAVGHLCLLWLWAVENVPSGDLSDFFPQEIAESAHWDASGAEHFVDALHQSGYLDEDNKLHDWGVYAGDRVDFESIRIAGEVCTNLGSTNISKYVSEYVILSIISKLDNISLMYIYNCLYNMLFSCDKLTHSLTHIHKDNIKHKSYDSTLRLNISKSDTYINNTDLTCAREKRNLSKFVSEISNMYLGREAIPADISMVCEEMRANETDILSDDQCFLIETAYKQAWKMGKGIPYIRGCFRNFNSRGIKTIEDYKLYNVENVGGTSSEEFYLAALKASMKE